MALVLTRLCLIFSLVHFLTCGPSFGQQISTGGPERLYFPGELVNEKFIERYVSGTFWNATFEDEPVVLVTDALMVHRLTELGGITNGDDKAQGTPDDYKPHELASKAFQEAIKKPDAPIYSKLDALQTPNLSEVHIQSLFPELYRVQVNKSWFVAISGEDFLVWQPDQKQGLKFSCRQHAIQLLNPSDLTFKNNNPGNVVTWIEVSRDRFHSSPTPKLIGNKKKPGSGRIVHWSKAEKDWFLWLPETTNDSNSNWDSAFQLTDTAADASLALAVDDDVFTRLQDRSYSVADYNRAKFLTIPAILTRAMDRDSANDGAETMAWTPMNAYQAEWFATNAPSESSAAKKLIPPGMRQIVFETRNSPKDKYKMLAPSKPSRSDFGIWWPEEVLAEEHFGPGARFLPIFVDGKASYKLLSEITTAQWIMAQGYRAEGEGTQSASMRSYFLRGDANEQDLTGNLHGTNANASRVMPVKLDNASHGMWNRLASSWDNCNGSSDRILNGLCWGSFEVVYARSLFANVYSSDFASGDYGSPGYLRSLQLNSFADYFVDRTIAYTDFELNPAQQTLQPNNIALNNGVRGALYQGTANQASRYFTTEEVELLNQRMNDYVASRNDFVTHHLNGLPNTATSPVAERVQTLINPLSEPVTFVPALTPLSEPAATNTAPTAPPPYDLNAFINASQRLRVRYFDSPNDEISVSWRLPHAAELTTNQDNHRIVSASRRNWSFPSGATQGYTGSPLVSEWACDVVDGKARYYVVGLNRWSDLPCLQEDLLKGIEINCAEGKPPEFVSPVISLRWVIEVDPKKEGDQPGSEAPATAPSEAAPTTTCVATEAREPAAKTSAKDALDTELNEYLEDIFGDGKLGEAGLAVIPSHHIVKKSIEENYGIHPYWKIQYLRYLVFSGHWGPRRAIPAGQDNPVVPHDNLTDCQILQELRILFPSKRDPSECKPIALTAND